MQTKGIYLGWIVVKDINKAIEFYTKTLGLTLRDYAEEHKWAELSGPEGMTLGLTQENLQYGMASGTNAVMTLTVDDIDKARHELILKNVNVQGDVMEVPGHVKLQSFKDADGNAFQLVQMIGS